MDQIFYLYLKFDLQYVWPLFGGRVPGKPIQLMDYDLHCSLGKLLIDEY